MKKETIKNKVFEIIKSRLFHKDTPLTMESKLEDDLWMDSLDEVEILLDHGVSGSANRIASLSSTINMIAQMSRITIYDFGERMRGIVPLAYNPLSYLDLGRVEFLSDRLSSEVTGKDVRINLNEQPGIVKAFTAISNALLRPEVFEKAFEKAG